MMLIPLAAHALFARPLVLGRSSEAAIEMTLDNSVTGSCSRSTGAAPRRSPQASRSRHGCPSATCDSPRLAQTPFADRLVEKFQLPVVGWRGRSPRTR